MLTDFDLLTDFTETRSVSCAVLANDADLLCATGLDRKLALAMVTTRVASADHLEGMQFQVAASIMKDNSYQTQPC